MKSGMKFRLILLGFILIALKESCYAVESSAPWEEDCTSDGPLGMISGAISNWQITASSTYPASWAKNCQEWSARLYQKNGVSWCAKYKSSSEWLQVDLGVIAQVTGVMTQGRGDGSEWIPSFMLSYSLDGSQYTFITDAYNNQKIFEGNSDAYTVKHNYLDATIKARFIKFHTYTWHGHPSLRVEILGCQPCKHVLSMPPYARLLASSARGGKTKKTCTEEYGHIFSNKAWCARRVDNRQWLQLDIGPPTLVTGVITKGRGDTKKQQWVTRYKLSYSNDSRVWFFYKDANYLDPRIFEGNKDKDSEKTHYLVQPFVARFIRFHPIAWHVKVAMRAGLLGCRHKGLCGTGFFRINNQSSCVANLAYKKAAWVNTNTPRHRKRHLNGVKSGRGGFFRDDGQASFAVDGGLHRCTVLQYRRPFDDVPTWYVDLKENSHVSGVVIHTGKPNSQDGSDKVNPQYLANLDRLAVYVDNQPRRHQSGQLNSPQLCGYITRLNGRGSKQVIQSKIHIPCRQPLRGRFVYVEARGVAYGWSKEFAAILCEVMIY